MNLISLFHTVAVFLLMAPRQSAFQKFVQRATNTDFKGLYQLNGFDLALLIPYFVVLIILANYGFHRYTLVYLYYKNRKNKLTDPPAHFTELPRVTIQLPIFNEQFVV